MKEDNIGLIVPIQDKDFFDERVAVFAALHHISSGLDVIIVATHFYHSQNNVLYEGIRCSIPWKPYLLQCSCVAEAKTNSAQWAPPAIKWILIVGLCARAPFPSHSFL